MQIPTKPSIRTRSSIPQLLKASVCGLLISISTICWPAGRGYAPWVGDSFSGTLCEGEQPANYGPYDYILDPSKVGIVEKHHFPKEVERLTGGGAGTYPAGGISYTLKVIPNHHRALNSAINLHFKLQRKKGRISRKEALRSPIECYLQRAIRYSPRDATSHMLYGILLHKSDMHEDAQKAYENAMDINPSDANIQYNYALLLVDMKKYEEAREIADSLYSKNFPYPGLENKLRDAGY